MSSAAKRSRLRALNASWRRCSPCHGTCLSRRRRTSRSRPCRHGREDPGRYAGLVALARARDGDEAPFPREGFGVTTWVVCVDVIALLVTVVALVIITVLAMLLLDLCLCCFGGCCARDDDDARRADTADAATETLLPRPVLEGDKPAKR